MKRDESNEGKLRKFKRKIFGPHHDTTANQYRLGTIIQIRSLYSERDNLQEIKFVKLRQEVCVHRLYKKRIEWVKIPSGDKPPGQHRICGGETKLQ